jgi:NADPH:quinone reductase-like Zn-dependent oxidoreductase
MKAVVFDEFGEPDNVLQVRDVPVPEPGPGQVRVRMLASPINPSDLLTVRGRYGARPALPATPGFEGVGIVEATGGGLIGRLRLGRRVAVLNGRGGNWQEQVIVPARQVVPVSTDLPDDQAASFFVNPASALVMVRYVLRVPRGAWLLQTAAGSALGGMVRRLAKHDGFRTINVVRRREQAEELRQDGHTTICTNEEPLEERAREITGGVGVRFALDAVGGATGTVVLKTLAPHGRMVVYGTLAEEPMMVSPRILMVGQKRVEGFWMAEWVRGQSPMKMLGLFRQIGKLLRQGVLTTEVGATFPLSRILNAVKQAELPGRKGKVLLRLTS